MKTIALIRHGLDQGDGLAPRGVAQIESTGEWLSQFFTEPVRICCSPTGRARETAQILGNYVPVEQIIECGSLDIDRPPFRPDIRIATFGDESNFTQIPNAIWVVHLNLAKILRQIIREEMPSTSVPVEAELQNGEAQIYRYNYVRNIRYLPR